jgi:hypothetical protein
MLADVLQADQIIIATAGCQFDNASIQELCKEVREKPWRRTRPRVRVITGLGTDSVSDHEANLVTSGLTPWTANDN